MPPAARQRSRPPRRPSRAANRARCGVAACAPAPSCDPVDGATPAAALAAAPALPPIPRVEGALCSRVVVLPHGKTRSSRRATAPSSSARWETAARRCTSTVRRCASSRTACFLVVPPRPGGGHATSSASARGRRPRAPRAPVRLLARRRGPRRRGPRRRAPNRRATAGARAPGAPAPTRATRIVAPSRSPAARTSVCPSSSRQPSCCDGRTADLVRVRLAHDLDVWVGAADVQPLDDSTTAAARPAASPPARVAATCVALGVGMRPTS